MDLPSTTQQKLTQLKTTFVSGFQHKGVGS